MSFIPARSLKAWAELLRPPNLPTVPGDSLAGFVLASADRQAIQWSAAWPVCVAAVSLYASGLIWNDCADLKEDSVTRPERPLPSGRVASRDAFIAAAVLGATGIALAALCGRQAAMTATFLVMLTLSYDFLSRRIRWLGFLNMGACRGASLLMGASAAAAPTDWPAAVCTAAAGITVFVTVITWVASGETDAIRLAGLRWLPTLSVIVCFAAVFGVGGRMTTLALASAAAAAGCLAWCASRLSGAPEPELVGKSMGVMIRTLILVQAGLCATASLPAGIVGAIALLAWSVSLLLSKRFYAS